MECLLFSKDPFLDIRKGFILQLRGSPEPESRKQPLCECWDLNQQHAYCRHARCVQEHGFKPRSPREMYGWTGNSHVIEGSICVVQLIRAFCFHIYCSEQYISVHVELTMSVTWSLTRLLVLLFQILDSSVAQTTSCSASNPCKIGCCGNGVSAETKFWSLGRN